MSVFGPLDLKEEKYMARLTPTYKSEDDDYDNGSQNLSVLECQMK